MTSTTTRPTSWRPSSTCAASTCPTPTTVRSRSPCRACRCASTSPRRGSSRRTDRGSRAPTPWSRSSTARRRTTAPRARSGCSMRSCRRIRRRRASSASSPTPRQARRVDGRQPLRPGRDRGRRPHRRLHRGGARRAQNLEIGQAPGPTLTPVIAPMTLQTKGLWPCSSSQGWKWSEIQTEPDAGIRRQLCLAYQLARAVLLRRQEVPDLRHETLRPLVDLALLPARPGADSTFIPFTSADRVLDEG